MSSEGATGKETFRPNLSRYIGLQLEFNIDTLNRSITQFHARASKALLVELARPRRRASTCDALKLHMGSFAQISLDEEMERLRSSFPGLRSSTHRD